MKITSVFAPRTARRACARPRPHGQPRNGRRLLGLAVATALASGLLPGAAESQQASACITQYPTGPIASEYVQACEALKERMMGAWSLVAYERVLQDGQRIPLMEASPKGMIVLDAVGHFALVLARPDLPDFDRTKSADDAKAIAEGMRASFGRYTLTDNGYARLIELRADFPAGPAGRNETGRIKSLTADELEYDLNQPFGVFIRLAWKRAR